MTQFSEFHTGWSIELREKNLYDFVDQYDIGDEVCFFDEE